MYLEREGKPDGIEAQQLHALRNHLEVSGERSRILWAFHGCQHAADLIMIFWVPVIVVEAKPIYPLKLHYTVVLIQKYAITSGVQVSNEAVCAKEFTQRTSEVCHGCTALFQPAVRTSDSRCSDLPKILGMSVPASSALKGEIMLAPFLTTFSWAHHHDGDVFSG